MGYPFSSSSATELPLKHHLSCLEQSNSKKKLISISFLFNDVLDRFGDADLNWHQILSRKRGWTLILPTFCVVYSSTVYLTLSSLKEKRIQLIVMAYTARDSSAVASSLTPSPVHQTDASASSRLVTWLCRPRAAMCSCLVRPLLHPASSPWKVLQPRW
jgi:hypothetical protein